MPAIGFERTPELHQSELCTAPPLFYTIPMTGLAPSGGANDRQVFGSVDDFAEAARDLTVAWQIQSRESSSFMAALRRRAFGDYLFGELQYGPCTGIRDGNEIERSGERYICLTLYNDGQLHFIQDGKTLEIDRNDLVLWDASIPTVFDCHADTQCDLLWIPARLIERRMGRLDRFLSRKVSPTQGTARILAPYMRSLHSLIEDVPDAARKAVLDASIELIFSCFDPENGDDVHSTRAAELLARARREIADRVELDEVSPEDVAQALGIGVRYLHKIFSTTGQTFSACVARERLDRAHQALINPRLCHTTTTEIAHRFGFYDSSHFNRSFKRRYGMTPAAYRAHAALAK